MRLRHLPPDPSAVEPPHYAGADHPMRKVTRHAAFDGEWSPERAGKVAALFDDKAAAWTADHDAPERVAALIDALERGDVPAGRVLELGSGTGLGTRILAQRCPGPVVALDLAMEMLRHAPPEYAPRVRADAVALPVRSGAVDVVVLVNALLFPAEVDRVLAVGGVVVWVNTLGDQTPIHLPADDVLAALPGTWHGLASRAGTGTWLVARRADDARPH